MTDAPSAPASGVITHLFSPDFLTHIFSTDPTLLSTAEYTALAVELRRRRNAFLSSEAADRAKGKKARTKPDPMPASVRAELDKPTAELDLSDLMKKEG